jgi:hypothetical protein
LWFARFFDAFQSLAHVWVEGRAAPPVASLLAVGALSRHPPKPTATSTTARRRIMRSTVSTTRDGSVEVRAETLGPASIAVQGEEQGLDVRARATPSSGPGRSTRASTRCEAGSIETTLVSAGARLSRTTINREPTHMWATICPSIPVSIRATSFSGLVRTRRILCSMRPSATSERSGEKLQPEPLRRLAGDLLRNAACRGRLAQAKKFAACDGTRARLWTATSLELERAVLTRIRPSASCRYGGRCKG